MTTEKLRQMEIQLIIGLARESRKKINRWFNGHIPVRRDSSKKYKLGENKYIKKSRYRKVLFLFKHGGLCAQKK